jgi:hypothetical protein
MKQPQSNTIWDPQQWPYLTHIQYLGKDYWGIVQNSDTNFVHMYVIEQNMSAQLKQEFISCGEMYWWGSNRQMPINVFLGQKFSIFKSHLKIFSTKEVVLISGPMPSLDTLINRRSKKRTVQLVKTA